MRMLLTVGALLVVLGVVMLVTVGPGVLVLGVGVLVLVAAVVAHLSARGASRP